MDGNLPEWIGAVTGVVAYGESKGWNARVRQFFQTLAEAGITPERLSEATREDDLLREVTEMGARASADTSDEMKRLLLGRVVAGALNSTGIAAPDEARMLVRAVGEIDPVHVQLLTKMATPRPGQGLRAGTRYEGWLATSEVGQVLPEVEGLEAPILAGLLRAGLVDQMTQADAMFSWAPSRHGRKLLNYVSEGGLGEIDLAIAVPVLRVESQPPQIVFRNLGPGVASDVHISIARNDSSPVLDDAADEMMGMDLAPFDEIAFPTRIPTLSVSPPYLVYFRWTDQRGRNVDRATVDVDRS